MNKEQFSAIETAIHIIDDNIKNLSDMDELSKKVGMSKYHLHRLFKAITGKPLMSYVRGRRLSLSISDLLNTKLKIIDIAAEYQFEHEQSYIRAFKQKYNITPSKYRKNSCELLIEQKIDTSCLCNTGQGLVIEPRMCIKPQFLVQGIKKEIVHEENLRDAVANKFAKEFQKEYLPLLSAINKDLYIGLVRYTGHSDYGNDYIPCTEVTDIKELGPPFAGFTIPAQEYAVFRYIGFHSPYDITYATLLDLYDYIYRWKIYTKYLQLKHFHFERMNLKLCGKSYCEMDIYIPISTKLSE